MTVTQVDFKSDRHEENKRAATDMLAALIDQIDGRIAGFTLVVWDDSGEGFAGIAPGGPISLTATPTYAHDRLSTLANTVLARECESSGL